MGVHPAGDRPVSNNRPANNRPAPGGRRAPAPPPSAQAAIGIIANPMSGRDIRRLVARASVFPNAEKANMILRLIAAAGALGVGRVLVSTDTFGISAGVLRASRRAGAEHDQPWPALEFVALDALTGTAEDTRETTRRM